MANQNDIEVVDEVTEDPDFDVEPENRSMTTFETFMEDSRSANTEIQDLGVVTVDEESPTVIVRPIVEIGPLFYGFREVHMLKGRQYRVPQDIARYLRERNLDWDQQGA